VISKQICLYSLIATEMSVTVNMRFSMFFFSSIVHILLQVMLYMAGYAKKWSHFVWYQFNQYFKSYEVQCNVVFNSELSFT